MTIAPKLAVAAVGLLLALGTRGEGAASARTGTASPDAVLVLVVNPSARVHTLVFRHAEAIIASAGRESLTVVATYEQRDADDGPPFDRPFLETQSPHRQQGASCHGTAYQRHLCLDRFTKKGVTGSTKLAAWRTATIASLRATASKRDTEEAPGGRWNLHGALVRAGEVFRATPTARHCLVLLGGLASNLPGPDVQPALLTGAQVVVSGAVASPPVQAAWTARLGPVGARLTYVPAEITELRLIPVVRNCVGG